MTDLAALGLAVVIVARGTFAALPFMALIVLGLAYGRGRLAAALSLPRAIIVGEVSYSLYMVHLLVMEAVYAPIEYSRFSPSVDVRVAALPIALAAAALATVLMHRYVEVPWRRRLLGAFPPAVVATPR